MPKNDDADQFLSDIRAGSDETVAEKRGRHYAEGELRFATAAALTELAGTVTNLASTQATMSIAFADLSKDFKEASKDVALMKVWMEGTVTETGERVPGVIDHIGTFRRWKNWVLTLLTAILLSQIIGTLAGIATHPH